MYMKNPRGYIALMATIIISFMLLSMVAKQGFSGWYIRFIMLGTEAKAQAEALALGCVEHTRAELAGDPSYIGGDTVEILNSSGQVDRCYIAPVAFGTPLPTQATVITQASVRGSFATFSTIVNLSPLGINEPPEILSVTEVP